MLYNLNEMHEIRNAFKSFLVEEAGRDLKQACKDSDYPTIHKILFSTEISFEEIDKLLEKAIEEKDKILIDILTNYKHDPKRQIDNMILADKEKLVQVPGSKDNNKIK